MKEHDEQRKVFSWANWASMRKPELRLLFAIPNAGKRSIGAAQYAKSEGLKAGVPDMMLPVASQGWHGLFIELKIKPNKPSEAQSTWLADLACEGYLAKICWSADEAIKTLGDYVGLNKS